MSDTAPYTPDRPPAGKQRHGCLTAYLVLMIIANSVTGLIYLFASGTIRRSFPNMPEWAFISLASGAILNLICAIALFKWKKWGFWGLSAAAVVIFIANVAIGFSGSAVVGLLGVAIVYGVLHIGRENNGWSQLD